MKNFIKGVATVAVVMIVSLIIHIICNKNGINLDSTVTGTVSAISALLIYCGLTRKEKTKNDWKNELKTVKSEILLTVFNLSYRSYFLQDWGCGEGLRLVTDRLDSKNYYMTNPSFDKWANLISRQKRMSVFCTHSFILLILILFWFIIDIESESEYKIW